MYRLIATSSDGGQLVGVTCSESAPMTGDDRGVSGDRKGDAHVTLIIDQLQLDHRNMRLLLEIIEEQVDLYGAGTTPDFELMEQIIDYTLHYPNLIHHPREDLLFRRLLADDPDSARFIGDLVEDHVELAALTQRFAAALHNVARDVELPREWFETLVRNYIAMTRRHMEAEERSLFPRLLATLQDSDWASLDHLVTTDASPLFGSEVEKHYLRLHRRILQTGIENGG
ncbi:MAG: hemerythrin domain-containing protein [Dongiaceae bacterium]